MNLGRSIVVLCAFVAVAGCTASTPGGTTTSVNDSSTVPPGVVDVSSDDDAAPEPPPLVIVSGERRTAVPGYDYCWEGPDSGQAVCADWFGTQTPTHLEVGTAEVTVQWVDGATLTAGIRADGGSCWPSLAMEKTGVGEWSLAMPELPGTYRVGVKGISPQGQSYFAIEVTTSVLGSVPAPVASVWWPDTSDRFEPYVSAVGPQSGIEARLRVVSVDGVTTEFPMGALVNIEEGSPIECGSVFAVEHQDGPITFVYNEEALGATPYEVTLTVGVEGPEFERTWIWPDELGSEDTLTGTMQPTSGEPWHPDFDPLIDSDS